MTDLTPKLRKATPPIPPAATPPKPTKMHVLARFVGSRCVVQLQSGLLIEGQLTAIDPGVQALTLEHCHIVGKRHAADVDHLVVFMSKTVCFVHTLPTSLTPATP